MAYDSVSFKRVFLSVWPYFFFSPLPKIPCAIVLYCVFLLCPFHFQRTALVLLRSFLLGTLTIKVSFSSLLFSPLLIAPSDTMAHLCSEFPFFFPRFLCRLSLVFFFSLPYLPYDQFTAVHRFLPADFPRFRHFFLFSKSSLDSFHLILFSPISLTPSRNISLHSMQGTPIHFFPFLSSPISISPPFANISPLPFSHSGPPLSSFFLRVF